MGLVGPITAERLLVMRRMLVTIVGHDRPGIVQLVGRVLTNFHCNITEVSQTTLLGEFAGLFSAEMSQDISLSALGAELTKELDGTGLGHWIKEISPDDTPSAPAEVESYVITLRGPDRLGIIPEFAGAVAGFDVNIDNLRAVALSDGQTAAAAGHPHPVVLVFEVTVPRKVHQNAFRQALTFKAEELGMEVSLQHRDIFEAINRL